MANTIIAIVGASGTGKSTLEGHLVENYGLTKSVSFTTRKPRPGEVDGENYHFITPDKAEQLIKDGKTIEHNFFCDNYYGTLKSEIDKTKDTLVIVVEPVGLKEIKSYCDKNDIKLITAVLHNEPSVLVQRFMSRYKGKGIPSDQIDNVMDRLNTLLTVESKWKDIILKDIIPNPDYVGEYNENNQEEVQSILKSKMTYTGMSEARKHKLGSIFFWSKDPK